MEKLVWHTESRKISDLIPYEGNPRIMTKKQADDLRKSLEKFNLVEIPVIDTHDRIIAGHMRLKIMQTIGRGEEEIEVRVPNRELTEKEFREYNIRSNKNTGSWDMDILANSFDTSDLVEWGFEENELGISPDEPQDAEPQIDRAEELNKKWQVKMGDLWLLGNHKLLCGDSTKAEDVARVMGGEKADMVFTDPPYGINIIKGQKGRIGLSQEYAPIAGDDQPFDPTFLLKLSEKQIIFGGNYFAHLLPPTPCWLI